MADDIRLKLDFFDHPKTSRLIEILGTEVAPIYLIRLWAYAARYFPSGNLTGVTPEAIFKACGAHESTIFKEWEITPDRWIEALSEVGFGKYLADAHQYVIHDWACHQQWVIESRARSEQAKKAADTRWSYARALREQCSGDAPVMLTVDAPSPSPSPSPDPKKEKKNSCRKTATNGYQLGFCEGWKEYPHFARRSSKVESGRVWKQRKLEPLTEAVLAWIADMKNSPDAMKDNGQFVPAFQKFLRQTDFTEPPPPPQEDDYEAWVRETAEQAEKERQEREVQA